MSINEWRWQKRDRQQGYPQPPQKEGYIFMWWSQSGWVALLAGTENQKRRACLKPSGNSADRQIVWSLSRNAKSSSSTWTNGRVCTYLRGKLSNMLFPNRDLNLAALKYVRQPLTYSVETRLVYLVIQTQSERKTNEKKFSTCLVASWDGIPLTFGIHQIRPYRSWHMRFQRPPKFKGAPYILVNSTPASASSAQVMHRHILQRQLLLTVLPDINGLDARTCYILFRFDSKLGKWTGEWEFTKRCLASILSRCLTG